MDDKHRIFVVDDQRYYVFNQVEPQTVFHNLIFSLVKSAIALNEISFINVFSWEIIFITDSATPGFFRSRCVCGMTIFLPATSIKKFL